MGNLCCRGVMDEPDAAPAKSPMYEAGRAPVPDEAPLFGGGRTQSGSQPSKKPSEHIILQYPPVFLNTPNMICLFKSTLAFILYCTHHK